MSLMNDDQNFCVQFLQDLNNWSFVGICIWISCADSGEQFGVVSVQVWNGDVLQRIFVVWSAEHGWHSKELIFLPVSVFGYHAQIPERAIWCSLYADTNMKMFCRESVLGDWSAEWHLTSGTPIMDCCCKWHLCCFHPISLGSAMLFFVILAPRTCHHDFCTSNHVLEICEQGEAIFVKLFSVRKSSWHNVFSQWLKWWSRESSFTGQLLPPAESHSSSSNSALSKPILTTTNLSTRNFGVSHSTKWNPCIEWPHDLP
jgi:hypothetical protein